MNESQCVLDYKMSDCTEIGQKFVVLLQQQPHLHTARYSVTLLYVTWNNSNWCWNLIDK